MAFPQWISSFVLLLVLLLSSSARAADKPTQDLIDKICRQMEDYGFCNKVFNDNIGSQSADLTILMGITIDQVLKGSSQTQAIILDVIPKVTDYQLKLLLQVCQGGYNQVTLSFTDAQNSFKAKMFDDMNKEIRFAPRAQASCSINFKEPSAVGPLVDANTRMRILVAMAVVAGQELAP